MLKAKSFLDHEAGQSEIQKLSKEDRNSTRILFNLLKSNKIRKNKNKNLKENTL